MNNETQIKCPNCVGTSIDVQEIFNDKCFNTKGIKKEAAYSFMNWWLSGWAGAFVSRQGYYISNPNRSKQYMTKAEWDYWYQGKPASEPLKGTDGKIAVNKGSIRNGGNYQKRLSHIAVWNSVMPNYDYSLQKWYQFIS